MALPRRTRIESKPANEGPDRRDGDSVTAVLARNAAICGSLLLSLFARSGAAEENDVVLRSEALTTPFFATVRPPFARVQLHPQVHAPDVGLVRKGARVVVTSCQPDCTAQRAWAILGNDGAIRLALLAREPTGGEVTKNSAAERLWYGRVGKSGITIFREPRVGGPIITRQRLSREMAFWPNAELWRSGWMERADGGFVRARRVRLLTPSVFQGEAYPQLPIAFGLRDLHMPGDRRTIGLRRYDRFTVQEIDGVTVSTSRGTLPRSALRLVTLHSPPEPIPPGSKWVLVDLSEQTLTAYEGETAVYATLISSGKDHEESETHAGLFQVEHKMTYSTMRGDPDDPYEVDRVPYTLYFNKNEALHGAYWHDRFGWPMSHGCVNLALADARWLFDWSPPKLPENWSTIEPRAARLSSLWVFIKNRPTLNQIPQLSPTTARQTGGM